MGVPVVRFCRVINNSDPEGGNRVKVFLAPEDYGKEEKDIDYAFPILPKMFRTTPKVGEGVLVLLAITDVGDSQRYYIGPVISQDTKMSYDSYLAGADTFFRGAGWSPMASPEQNPLEDGCFPSKDAVSVVGRRNSEVILNDSDVSIRAGVRNSNMKDDYHPEFNGDNPAYLKLKYYDKSVSGESADCRSTATLVADKIAFLGNKSTQYPQSVGTKGEALISDEQMADILAKAYRLPYGELLIEFLVTLTNAFVQHTHNYPCLPPNSYYTEELLQKKARLLDNEELLSDTIKLN